jgi:sugar-specific transcriptional regulator TrmB
MNNINELLEKIGLTKQEAKTYLKLLELKEAQTGILSHESGIATSNLYHVLESLMKMGLASYRLQNNIKIFMPSPPEALNELFITKQKELDEERKQVAEAIANLKKKEIKKPPISRYKYYQGIQGIKSMWYEMNESLHSLKKGTTTKYYTGIIEAYTPLIGFYDEFHKLRVKLSIPNQAIFPFEDKKTAMRRKRQKSEVRFMDLKNEAEWGVFGNLFFIQYITAKTPRGFLIQDEKFAKTFEQVFDQLWKQAKP